MASPGWPTQPSSAPTLTTSLGWASAASSTPVTGLGISESTLSVLTSSRASYSETPSPTDLSHLVTVASVTALVADASLRPHVRQTLHDMLTEVAALNHRVRAIDITIKELVNPLAPTLLQITGISHTSAAVLIAEIGDITRFSSSAKLARYTGCAPIPVYSSDNEHHRLHRGGNRRLNSVFYTAAIVQKRLGCPHRCDARVSPG
jgi:transposase